MLSDLHRAEPNFRLNDMVMSPDLVNALRSEIDTSTDSALLSKVGTALVVFREDQQGLRLIQRAIDLDPSNPKVAGSHGLGESGAPTAKQPTRNL